MTDKKFTQEQIIKGLECHIGKEPKGCELCPYTIYGCDCLEKLHFALYDLIKRLKTRIVRYQLKNTNQRNALASLNKKVAEQKAEIINRTEEYNDMLEQRNKCEAGIEFREMENKSLESERNELYKLVAEQKAEIEMLNKKLDESLELATDFEADLNNRDAEIKDLKAEIEGLQEELKITRAAVHNNGLEWGLISIKKLVDDTKTKAIKEFAERLIDIAVGRWVNTVSVADIDNLVKEMMEE